MAFSAPTSNFKTFQVLINEKSKIHDFSELIMKEPCFYAMESGNGSGLFYNSQDAD